VIPASHLDLLAAPLTATVTTIGADGFPQSSAVWFMWEDGRLWYSTKHWTAKYRNVEARPETSFLVLDPHDEFRYVEIRGTASVGADPGCAGRDRIRAKHRIAPGAPDPAADARVIVTIEPVHVTVHGGPRRLTGKMPGAPPPSR
jgi:PPOX class probable F420-dependent enzyme